MGIVLQAQDDQSALVRCGHDSEPLRDDHKTEFCVRIRWRPPRRCDFFFVFFFSTFSCHSHAPFRFESFFG